MGSRRSGSNFWAGLKRGNSILRQGIKWKLGANSTLNFWHDKWLTLETVRGLIEGPLRRNEELLTVNDMRDGGRWDFTRCSFDLLDKLISLVKVVPIPLNH